MELQLPISDEHSLSDLWSSGCSKFANLGAQLRTYIRQVLGDVVDQLFVSIPLIITGT